MGHRRQTEHRKASSSPWLFVGDPYFNAVCQHSAILPSSSNVQEIISIILFFTIHRCGGGATEAIVARRCRIRCLSSEDAKLLLTPAANVSASPSLDKQPGQER